MPRLAAVVLLLLVWTATAAAKPRPRDPLYASYGKPTATFTHTVGRYLYACERWQYVNTVHRVTVEEISRCVLVGIVHKHKGAASPGAPPA